MSKKITVNEIDKVLDEALSDYKLGKTQCKNIIFVGNDGIGKSSRINRWMETHSGEVTPVYLTTAPLWKEENGILVKDLKNGKPQYVLCVPPEGLLEDGAIGFCKNLNYSSGECIQPLEQIFSDRTYCFPGMDNKQDLHKLFLIIATAYPDDFGYNVADISNIKKYSDVYTVTPSVDEFKEYFDNNVYADIDGESKIENFKKILSSPHFQFISEKNEKFSPCNFMGLFGWCETGSADEILSNVKQKGKAGEKTFEMFEKILNKD